MAFIVKSLSLMGFLTRGLEWQYWFTYRIHRRIFHGVNPTDPMAHDLGMIYPILVVLSGGISGLIFLLSLGVALRRRQLPYLLVAVALAALVGRAGVAAADIAGS